MDNDSAQQPRARQRPDGRRRARSGRNAAIFVATPGPLPVSLTAGRQYAVAITMRNTGTTVWRADGDHPHRLGSQHPRNTTVWGLGRIDVPAEIQPGAEATFAFTVVAPVVPGRYYFQWRMVQDGVGWFGDSSPATAVTVERSAGTPPGACDPTIRLHVVDPAGSMPFGVASFIRDLWSA